MWALDTVHGTSVCFKGKNHLAKTSVQEALSVERELRGLEGPRIRPKVVESADVYLRATGDHPDFGF